MKTWEMSPSEKVTAAFNELCRAVRAEPSTITAQEVGQLERLADAFFGRPPEIVVVDHPGAWLYGLIEKLRASIP